jgi:hypothetical protein
MPQFCFGRRLRFVHYKPIGLSEVTLTGVLQCSFADRQQPTCPVGFKAVYSFSTREQGLEHSHRLLGIVVESISH